MSKLQITHNWKTYSWISDKWGNTTIDNVFLNTEEVGIYNCVVVHSLETLRNTYTFHTPDQLVKLWYMELQPQEEKPEQSILQNLRAELERRKEAGYEQIVQSHWDPRDDAQAYAYWWVLNRLNELETQPEEPVPLSDKWTEQYIADNQQFTPWEMIEVSNDNEKWEKRQLISLEKVPLYDKTFLESMPDKEYPKTKGDNWFAFAFWKYARPIKEEIELLPEFNWKEIRETGTMWIYDIWKHLELLTNTVNKLLKK